MLVVIKATKVVSVVAGDCGQSGKNYSYKSTSLNDIKTSFIFIEMKMSKSKCTFNLSFKKIFENKKKSI